MFESMRAAIRRVRARIPTLAELVVGDTVYDIPLHTPVATPPPAPTSAHGMVAVGAFPTGVAVSPDGAHAYVINSGDDSVSVIDVATGTAAVTLAVGRAPYGIALTPDGRTAYVANAGGNSVSIIDTHAQAVTGTIAVGEKPYGVAVAPDGERVYVTNQAGGSLTVIDSSSLLFAQALIGVKSTIAVGIAPTGVAISADGQRAYVVDNEAHALVVVDTIAGKVTDTIPVGKHPAQVAITPDGAQAFATNAGGGSVSVVDLATTAVTETLLVNDHPIGVAVGADGRFAYVTALDASLLVGTVTVIDIATGTTNTVRAGAPYGVAADPAGDYAFITDFRAQTVSMVTARDESNDLTEFGFHAYRRGSGRPGSAPAISIDRCTGDVVADPDTGRAFVIHTDDDAIEVIDSSGHAAVVDVGRYPSALVLTPDGTRAYVTNYEDGSLSIIDIAPDSDSRNTVVGTLEVGFSWSTGVMLSGDGSRAYAVDKVNGHLSVIDTVAGSPRRDTVIGGIELGDPPTSLHIAPSGRWVYAINHFDHVVWAVHTATNRTAAIPVPGYPYRISISPNGLRLYASLCEDGSTCVIDTDPGSATYHRIIARLRIDGYGADPVFTTAGARAYVVNADANSVSVIDTATSLVKSIAVGQYPWDVALSPDGRRAYVVNNLDDSLSVLGPATDSVTATVAVGARRQSGIRRKQPGRLGVGDRHRGRGGLRHNHRRAQAL
jgi:YVTN family beta-propeller protein